MLLPEDFEQGIIPVHEFTLPPGNFTFGEKTLQNYEISAFYDRHGSIYFKIKNTFRFFELFELADQEICLSGDAYPEPIDLGVSSTSSDHVILFPKRQPVFVDFGKLPIEAHAILLNGPDLPHTKQSLEIADSGRLLSICKMANTASLRNKNSELRYDRIPTHTLKIYGQIPTKDTVLEIVGRFCRFLVFVRGGWCGWGNILGVSSDGSAAFAYLGFARSDHFKIIRGWCDAEVIGDVPEVYQLYLKNIIDTDNETVFIRTLEYYRAANSSYDSSIEVSIVASYAGLETVVPHILKSHGGMSRNFVDDMSFLDQLRAATSLIGLNSPPLCKLTHLQHRAESETGGDGLKLLTRIRNRITHFKLDYSLGGKELLEAHLMSQWLCEIFLFHLMHYRGKMADRREWQGWVGGNIIDVPLA